MLSLKPEENPATYFLMCGVRQASAQAKIQKFYVNTKSILALSDTTDIEIVRKLANQRRH